MDLTFHLVPQRYFDALDPHADYVPAAFAREGFIHCTDGADEMAHIANRYYQLNSEPHYYLTIDQRRVRAPIRYDDPERKYLHILRRVESRCDCGDSSSAARRRWNIHAAGVAVRKQ